MKIQMERSRGSLYIVCEVDLKKSHLRLIDCSDLPDPVSVGKEGNLGFLTCLLNTNTFRYFYFILFYFFKFFYCYSITVVCLFSPSLHPHPSQTPFPPPSHPPPWFGPCVLYSSSCNPLSSLSPPHSPLPIVRLFLTSMSLVIFCLLFSSIYNVLLKGEIIWYLSLTVWLISLSIMLSSSIHAVAKGRSFLFLSPA